MGRRTTNFVLNEQQERELVSYCVQRVRSLREDNRARMEADRRSWLAYKNSRDDRKANGGVFAESNLVLPLTSMIVESFVSRAEDEMLETEPFFRSKPRGADDEELVKECEAYFPYKFGPQQADVKTVVQDGLLSVFVQRAAIFKVVRSDQFAEWIDGGTTVLWDKQTGKPVLVPGREGAETTYVTDDAEWDKVEQPIEGGGTTVRSILRQDPSVVWSDAKHEFKPPPKPLLRQAPVYRGAKAVAVDSDAFLCPTTAASVDEADFCAHTYDQTLAWVGERFIDRQWMNWRSFRASYLHETAKAKTETDRNKEAETLSFDEKTKMLKLVECWVRRDVLGWGRPQEFMVLIEPDKEKAIYYEFQANLCPDMRRPFITIAVAPDKGSWCGESLPEKLEQFQDYADKQFNRESVRNSRNANPIGVVNPDVVEEEPDTLELGDGGLFTKKPGKDGSKFIDWSAIPNLDTNTRDLLEFVIYMVQLWLSVSNLSQGDYGELPQNSTKFGIEATLKEASRLGRRYIRRIIGSINKLLTKMVKLQIDGLDEEEAFFVTEGKSERLAQMTPEKVRKLDVDVSIIVSRQGTEAEIKAAQMALEVQERYFATPPAMQPAVRPILERILEALGYKDVAALLPVATMPKPGENPLAVAGGEPERKTA